MNRRKYLLLIIVVISILIILLLLLNKDKRYNSFVVSDSKIKSIVKNREEGNIDFYNIKFNDYNLIIDKDNKIYYSIVDSRNKNNPIVDVDSEDKNIKIVFNKKIDDYSDSYEMIVYNDSKYEIFEMIIVDKPIISITDYDDKKMEAKMYLFDNSREASKKVTNSMINFRILSNGDYALSLKQESLGRNKRDNRISILGMKKHVGYVLSKNNDNDSKEVVLFINNEYIGNYYINYDNKK